MPTRRCARRRAHSTFRDGAHDAVSAADDRSDLEVDVGGSGGVGRHPDASGRLSVVRDNDATKTRPLAAVAAVIPSTQEDHGANESSAPRLVRNGWLEALCGREVQGAGTFAGTRVLSNLMQFAVAGEQAFNGSAMFCVDE